MDLSFCFGGGLCFFGGILFSGCAFVCRCAMMRCDVIRLSIQVFVVSCFTGVGVYAGGTDWNAYRYKKGKGKQVGYGDGQASAVRQGTA